MTYDMGITASGVIRLAPFGQSPMAIGADSGMLTSLPRLPLGAPELGLALALVLAFALALLWYWRRARRLAARDQ
ncbi:MAG: hypothetical protein ACRDHP_07390 [Ktedonobacterales bacterium]